MSRVITFSRVFPSYHPRAGEPTYFVEKLIRHLVLFDVPGYTTETIKQLRDIGLIDIAKLTPNGYKAHTIRAGHRFKVGDKFSPRVWSGKPYNSKQIIIGPDIKVSKTWDFDMKPELWLDECKFFLNGKWIKKQEKFREIALNDGLTPYEFVNWFAGSSIASSKRKPFEGQIICWSNSITY